MLLNLLLANLRMQMASQIKFSFDISEENITEFVNAAFSYAIQKIQPTTLYEFLNDLPQSFLIVLVSARKQLIKADNVTFEEIYRSYKAFHIVSFI